tara:strand:+ start:22050 stop:22322 length:273 start_codon:yes stop_codon:yes gene_type:complete
MKNLKNFKEFSINEEIIPMTNGTLRLAQFDDDDLLVLDEDGFDKDYNIIKWVNDGRLSFDDSNVLWVEENDQEIIDYITDNYPDTLIDQF